MRLATVQDLKDAIEHMEKDHKYNLKNCRVEVWHKNGSKRYGVAEISHFHILPDLSLIIKPIGEVDKIKI
jgi:hypothetical protein